MKAKRILSVLLTLLTVVSSIGLTSYASLISAGAAYEDKVDENGDPLIDYTSYSYTSAKEKLEDMELVREQDGYQLWYESFTGEVAVVKTETGETLFTNPYDVGSLGIAKSVKHKLLSQLAVTFSENGVQSTLYSYTDAALRGQIVCKDIKNGIRVEYAIGELQTTRLVPRMISRTRFETLILNNIKSEDDKKRLLAFYTLKDASDVSLTEANVKEMQAAFPVTKKFAVYVCEPDISDKELRTCETIIKAYCPTYTYEEMEQDHNDCDYVSKDVAPPNFKMAIEYTLSEDGLEARLPANGIRFDESTYTLVSITMLPYMGAGRSSNTGYTFVPDGSGSLIRFEDVKNTAYNVSGQMYGADYAYHNISGQHSETMTMPVFGVVENVGDSNKNDNNSPGMPPIVSTTTSSSYDRGYLAVITEGDSMANLMSEHGGGMHPYNNIYAIFYPRPSDSYNLADSISVSANTSFTVTSSRKYSGSYKIKYIMLGDDGLSKKAGLKDGEYYECSYVGMAKAYRDYLEGAGIIKRLTKDETGNDIPLYIEAFGAHQTVDRVLSFPVNVDTALTTFEDVQSMYDELAGMGVTNINFKLTGYYNGGLKNTYLAKLDWMKKVGGKSGFEQLLAYATEKNFGVYPDFDFAYQQTSDWFDGVWQKRDLVKSIDDRYMSKREYDAATQTFESDFALAISASTYEYFYNKFEANYGKYDAQSVSVSTLGSDLNSDFNEDDPYNREDAKNATTDLLAKLSEKYSVMVNKGNSYALQYADHVLDIATSSSNFLRASESIPFVTMVLHGYINYSGSAINMEGDIKNALLKSIESGSYLYFTLCYRNTSSLKESDTYNKYYSVSYEIWKQEMVEYYKLLNEALGDLQTNVIVNHEFVDATRILTEEDMENGMSASALNKYNTERGTVVRVEYDNGTSFIINYNSYDISLTVDGEDYEVEALGFIRTEK